MDKTYLSLLPASLVLILILFLPWSVSAGETDKTIHAKDFSHWLDAANIAAAMYESREDISAALKKTGFEISHMQQIEGFSVTYVLATSDRQKRHIIAVRGTANAENVIVDAAFVLVPDAISGIDIHQGFLLSARDIFLKVKDQIKPGYKIDTIGHSLGGAAAIILAMMLDAQDYQVGEVITFGQPKVTNISGSRQFEHLDITRLVTPKDVVPLLPPVDPTDLMNLSIFWHQGTEILLYKNNQYSVLTGINSMMRATDFLNDIPAEEHLSNHFMSTYIDYLKNKQISPVQVKYQSDFSFSDWFGGGPGSGSKQTR